MLHLSPDTCADEPSDWIDGVPGRLGNGEDPCTGATFTGMDCNGYRLPTEAEWEYVARAGQSTIWSFGDVLADLFNYAHLNVGHLPQPVGQKQDNACGVYDLYGNVSEWCEDWYQYGLSYGFGGCPPQQGNYKVFRGGSNGIGPQWLRSSSRNLASPDFRMYNVGLRVVRVDDPSNDPRDR